MYGKIIDGLLHRAPKKLIVGDTAVYNPTDEQLRNAGYKPVTMSDQPDDAPEGKHYESEWLDEGDAIILSWYLVDDPIDADIPAETALAILLGEEV